MNRALASVYLSPAVKQRIAEQRADLQRRRIPVFPIGRAYTPSLPRIPSDQEWVQRVVLR